MHIHIWMYVYIDIHMYTHIHTHSLSQTHAHGPLCVTWHIHICVTRLTYVIHTGWRTGIECLIFIHLFLRKSPIINSSFAERDLQVTASYASSPPCMCVTWLIRVIWDTTDWCLFFFFLGDMTDLCHSYLCCLPCSCHSGLWRALSTCVCACVCVCVFMCMISPHPRVSAARTNKQIRTHTHTHTQIRHLCVTWLIHGRLTRLTQFTHVCVMRVTWLPKSVVRGCVVRLTWRTQATHVRVIYVTWLTQSIHMCVWYVTQFMHVYVYT